jgi:Flp pilus assembly protein TadD
MNCSPHFSKAAARAGLCAAIVLVLFRAAGPGVWAQAGPAQPPAPTAQPGAPAPTAAQPTAPLISGSAVFRAATAALDAGDSERALALFSLVLVLNPTYTQAYVGRGIVYAGTGEPEAALADFDRAVAYAADNALRVGVLVSRAELNTALGRFDAAIADYSAALALAPTAEQWANRATLRIRQGDFTGALADIDQALADPAGSDPRYLLLRAFANEQLGDTAAADRDTAAYLFTSVPRPEQRGTLTPGEAVVVTLTEGAAFQFTFTAEAGARVSISAQARPGDSADPLLLLTDEDRDIIASDDDTGGGAAGIDALIRDVRIARSGTYTVTLGHALGGSEGQVAVILSVR